MPGPVLDIDIDDIDIYGFPGGRTGGRAIRYCAIFISPGEGLAPGRVLVLIPRLDQQDLLVVLLFAMRYLPHQRALPPCPSQETADA